MTFLNNSNERQQLSSPLEFNDLGDPFDLPIRIARVPIISTKVYKMPEFYQNEGARIAFKVIIMAVFYARYSDFRELLLFGVMKSTRT
jgi:hypothetical protein